MIDFASILRSGQDLSSMPPIRIDERTTDRFIVYNKNKTRLDRISYEIYGDATCWRYIMWANPEYFIEFDIPDDEILRVPYPLVEVEQEIIEKITLGKNNENLQV